MMSHTDTLQPVDTPCPPRTVVLVGRYAHQHLRDAMPSLVDCDVVFVESTAHAYSKIRRVRPDLVVLRLSSDDADGCQLLSMLALDRDTSRIPVLTCVIPDRDGDDATEPDPIADAFICLGPSSVN